MVGILPIIRSAFISNSLIYFYRDKIAEHFCQAVSNNYVLLSAHIIFRFRESRLLAFDLAAKNKMNFAIFRFGKMGSSDNNFAQSYWTYFPSYALLVSFENWVCQRVQQFMA